MEGFGAEGWGVRGALVAAGVVAAGALVAWYVGPGPGAEAEAGAEAGGGAGAGAGGAPPAGGGAAGGSPGPEGDMTPAELKAYDGSDEGKAVLVGVRGRIFDVSEGREFYGKGGPYNIFAGIDASVALARMSFKPEDLQNGDWENLSYAEKDTLDDWEAKFETKYRLVGKIVG